MSVCQSEIGFVGAVVVGPLRTVGLSNICENWRSLNIQGAPRSGAARPHTQARARPIRTCNCPVAYAIGANDADVAVSPRLGPALWPHRSDSGKTTRVSLTFIVMFLLEASGRDMRRQSLLAARHFAVTCHNRVPTRSARERIRQPTRQSVYRWIWTWKRRRSAAVWPKRSVEVESPSTPQCGRSKVTLSRARSNSATQYKPL